jgi:DNA-binding response OmpR family regulator
MDRSECRILAVDDEKELTDIVTELLRRENYSLVDIAASCGEAEDRVREKHYDLVLLDVMLPDGSFGLESSLIVHMRHLREKVETEPSKPRYLTTVRGLGYKLEKEK